MPLLCSDNNKHAGPYKISYQLPPALPQASIGAGWESELWKSLCIIERHLLSTPQPFGGPGLPADGVLIKAIAESIQRDASGYEYSAYTAEYPSRRGAAGRVQVAYTLHTMRKEVVVLSIKKL